MSRFATVFLAAALLACGTLAAQPDAGLKLTGDATYEPFTIVKLKAEGVSPKAALIWRVTPDEKVSRATTTRDRLEFVAPPGVYRVELLVITVDADGNAHAEERRTTVTIKSCCPPKPDEPKPPEPGPGGTLDPSNAIGRIQFGSAGCSATVVGPRRSDGRWDVLTAAHCIASQGQKGSMRMPKSGKTLGVTVVNFDRQSDLCWLVTDEPVSEIEYANLAKSNPSRGVKVWHQGYGVDVPRNREDGEVTSSGELTGGQLQFYLSVSSGDSGGGIFRADTNEVVSAVCCTQAKGVKTFMYGGSAERAWKMRPGKADDWQPLTVPFKE